MDGDPKALTLQLEVLAPHRGLTPTSSLRTVPLPGTLSFPEARTERLDQLPSQPVQPPSPQSPSPAISPSTEADRESSGQGQEPADTQHVPAEKRMDAAFLHRLTASS